jgi:hypothetical protein
MPLPVSVALRLLKLPLRVTVKVADSLPVLEGVNTTVMLQLFPALRVPGPSGQLPPKAKSPELEPRIMMLPIVIAVASVFFNVAVMGALA